MFLTFGKENHARKNCGNEISRPEKENVKSPKNRK